MDIHDKVSHVFDPLSRLWGIMQEEKEAAIQELSENNGDCSPMLAVSSLFEQSILLLGKAFITTSYFRRKNVFEILIDGKSKVKEILREQSDSLNDASNQFLFGEHFENEFSKSVNAKQKSKAQFTSLQKQKAKTSCCQAHYCKHQVHIQLSWPYLSLAAALSREPPTVLSKG